MCPGAQGSLTPLWNILPAISHIWRNSRWTGFHPFVIILINIDDKTQVRAHQRHRRGLHLHHARPQLPLPPLVRPHQGLRAAAHLRHAQHPHPLRRRCQQHNI